MLESDLLEFILSTSGAKARKCLNWNSWPSFYRLLEPKPQKISRGMCKFKSTSAVGSKTFLGATGPNHPWSSKSQGWMKNFRVVNVFKF